MGSRNSLGQTEEEFLKEYDSSKYKKPSVTTDNVIFYVKENNIEVLLIKRGNHPDINKWAFPGGFIEMDENLEVAALRELKEETNLEGIEFEQLHTFGDVDRDKRDRIITVVYFAVIEEKKKAVAGDDAGDAKWFSLDYEKIGIENSGEYILDIKLKKDDIELNPQIRVSESKGKYIAKKKYTQIKNDNMAGDHGKVLAVALEKFLEKF